MSELGKKLEELRAKEAKMRGRLKAWARGNPEIILAVAVALVALVLLAVVLLVVKPL